LPDFRDFVEDHGGSDARGRESDGRGIAS
jgi:hypothetical protein